MFSGLYGIGQTCFHKKGEPVNHVGVGVAAVLDVIGAVAIALLIAFGPKMGVNIPPTGQYLLGAAAFLNLAMLLNANIVPVSENYRT